MAGAIEKRRIIEKLHEGSMPGHLLFNDFYNRPGRISEKLANLINGEVLGPGTKGKLKVKMLPVGHVSPWYHMETPTMKQCGLWHDIYFKHFGFIPRGCRKCWKTVFKSHTDPNQQYVIDLFRMRDFLQSLRMPSKVGTDIRIYTPDRTNGYIYADSLEQGKMYHSIYSKRFLKEFPNGKVVLKRGCTEYEHRFGNPDEWDFNDQWDAMDEYFDYLIEDHEDLNLRGLVEHSNADTFRFWLERAYSIGDPTWKEAFVSQGYVPPEELFFSPQTYHDEE